MVNDRLLSELRCINYGYDIEYLNNRINYLFELQRHGCVLISDEEYSRCKNVLLELGYNVPHKVLYVESKRNLTDKYLDTNKISDKRVVRRFKDLVNIEELENLKVLAFLKVNGYDVRMVYSKGKLVSAVTNGSNGLGLDIKEHIEHLVKINDENIESMDIVEFRCKLTINDIDISSEEDLRDLVHFNKDRLKLYVVDILCDGIRFGNPLEKINVIKDLGYEVPRYIYDKCDKMDSSYIDKLIRQFGNNKNIEVSVYTNNEYNNKALEFVFNSRVWESKNITGIIDSIRINTSIHGLEPLVDIVYYEDNERKTLKDISLYNVGVMVDNGYFINNDIYFEMYRDGSIQLLNPKGELLL